MTATITGSNQIVLTGTLSSEPNKKYLIDFYGNAVCDTFGLGQGGYWIGCDTIQTDNFGFSNFYSVTNQITGTPPDFITATANNFVNFNTSEFSNCKDFVVQSPGVDLFVEKTDNLDSLLFGDTVTYEITVTNIGSDNATGVIMRDSLPSQLTYISDSTTHGNCTELDGVVQCNLGTFGSGESATITVLALSVGSGLTENTATVSANEIDIQPSNNSATDSTHMVRRIPTDVSDDELDVLPNHFEVSQNYPNPFNPSTEITYSLPIKAEVTVVIYNVMGQKVRVFDQGQQSAGEHSVTWNATDKSGREVASGMYFYKITAGDFSASRKMVLLK